MSSLDNTTQLLGEVTAGNRAAVDQLMALVYDEFRQLASHYLKQENVAHTLQPTALVNEVYLKLVDQSRVDWQGRTHFFAIGAQAMRRLLVDHARSKGRLKRGGGRHRISLDEELTISPRTEEDLLAVDDALEELAAVDARQAKIVELRFFGGLTVEEVAEVLEMSKRSVEREWTMVRAWLRRRLADDEGHEDQS